MVRSAAKNYHDVIVIVDPSNYSLVIEELRNNGDVSSATRYRLAVEAFSHTAYYDSIISGYLREQMEGGMQFPSMITLPL